MDGSVIVIGVRFDGPSPLAIDPSSVDPVLRVLADDEVEVALLATGERTELHLAGTDAAGAIERFHRALRSVGLLGVGSPRCLDADPYVAVGRDAVLHLGRVAAGLDSRVLGDLDGLDRIRTALEAAERAGTAGPVLREAYRCAVAAGRGARPGGRALGEDHRLRRLAGAVEAERLVRLAVARWADGDDNEEVAA